MRISHKIPLITSVVIITGFALFAWVQYNVLRNNLYENIENNIDASSQVLAHQITNWLNGKIALIDMASQTIQSDFSRESIQKTMDTPLLADEFILMFGALETDGQPISNTPEWNPGEGWDARVRPWYPLARSHTRAVLTEPYADSATNDILISVVANYYDNNTFKGAFGGDLSLSTVSKAVNTLDFNNTGYTFLLNRKGDIISHPNDSINGQHISTLFTSGVPKLNSTLQEINIDNAHALTYFRSLDNLYGSDWLIGVVLDKEKVLAEVYRSSLNTLIAAVITALLSSLILYLIINKVLLHPMNALTETAEEISRGKLSLKVTGTERKDEIGALAKSIERMANGLRIAVKRLRKKAQ
ncbi:HAMP domain-containing protein [Eionea flava]